MKLGSLPLSVNPHLSALSSFSSAIRGCRRLSSYISEESLSRKNKQNRCDGVYYCSKKALRIFSPLRRFRLTSGMSRCGSNHAGMKKKKKKGLQIFSSCTKRRMKTQDWHPTTSGATNHLRQNMCAASTGYT